MNEKELTELAAKAAQGNRGAFEKLYAEHARSILFHVRSLIYDKENYYDVAQDTVLEMFTNIHRLREPAAFRGWMHQVIRATCYAHNKALVREEKQQFQGDVDEELAALEDEDAQTDPEAATMAKLEGNRLFAMVNELPESFREVLSQRYLDDMTYKEIAEAQGITVSNVSTRLQRATEALRKKIKGTGEDYATHEKGKTMKEDTTYTPADDAADGVRASNDISIEDEGSLKSSLLVGTAMLFPSEGVAEFVSATNTRLDVLAAPLATTEAASTTGVKLTTKVLIATLSVVVVVAVVVGVLFIGTSNESEEGSGQDSTETVLQEQPEAPPYSGTAHLEFVDRDGISSDENVASITLVEDEPAAATSSWTLYWIADSPSAAEDVGAALTAGSKEQASGTGFEVESAALASLGPGYYLVVFTLTDTEGAAIEISRNFSITA